MSQLIIDEIDNIIARLNSLKDSVLENCNSVQAASASQTRQSRFKIKPVPKEEADEFMKTYFSENLQTQENGPSLPTQENENESSLPTPEKKSRFKITRLSTSEDKNISKGGKTKNIKV